MHAPTIVITLITHKSELNGTSVETKAQKRKSTKAQKHKNTKALKHNTQNHTLL